MRHLRRPPLAPFQSSFAASGRLSVWAIERKDCTAGPALARISIAPSAIRFYEGRAVVVTAKTSLERTAVLEVNHTSEGATNREAHTLGLNSTKKTLNYDRNGEAFTYVRCD